MSKNVKRLKNKYNGNDYCLWNEDWKSVKKLVKIMAKSFKYE